MRIISAYLIGMSTLLYFMLHVQLVPGSNVILYPKSWLQFGLISGLSSHVHSEWFFYHKSSEQQL